MDVLPVLEQQLSDVAAVDGVLLLHQQDQQLPDKNVGITIDDLKRIWPKCGKAVVGQTCPMWARAQFEESNANS